MWTVIFSVIITLLIVCILFYCFTRYEVGLIEGNLKLLAKSNMPDCYKTSAPICAPFNTPKLATDPESACTLVGAFISYIGTNDEKFINFAPYKLVYWKRDNMPIAIIYKNVNMTYVIFRGTLTGADFIADLNISEQIDNKGVLVHKGFNTIYKSIKDQLAIDTDNLFITGHSLGCALGLLLAYDNLDKNVSVINFAPPRTGNAAFAAKLDSFVTSYINIADIVPTLPPSFVAIHQKLYQYSHVGKIITFNLAQPDLLACHSTITYFTGIFGSNT